MLDAYIIDRLKKEKEEKKWEPGPLTVEVYEEEPEKEQKKDQPEKQQERGVTKICL